MHTFITTLETAGTGRRVAVKDLIDVEGIPTTAGSRAVAESAAPAERDAALLAGLRAAGARLVGKANLHELAFGTSGVNPWFGTPTNPLDASLVPGGSSSGSAVAVASGEADLALGSDTGGSIRIPAAFCGVTGLKTTLGRVPTAGVWPLAPSFDAVGPMARDVAGVVELMAYLEPGFAPSPRVATRIGRVRLSREEVDPAIDAAIDAALGASELAVVDVPLPEWAAAFAHGADLLIAEAASANAAILDDPARAALLSDTVRDRLLSGRAVSAERIAEARRHRGVWRARLDSCFSEVELLCLPSVGVFPPTIENGANLAFTRLTNPVNFAGIPAISLPVVSRDRLPASLQLIGPDGAEELLVATAARVEAAAGDLRFA